jgi:hypothetical protein
VPKKAKWGEGYETRIRLLSHRYALDTYPTRIIRHGYVSNKYPENK